MHSLHMAGVLWTCGSTGLFLSPYVYHQAVARLVRGIALGLVLVAVPLHSVEVSSGGCAWYIGEFQFFLAAGSLLAVYYCQVGERILKFENFHFVWLAECAFGVLVLVVLLISPKPANLQSARNSSRSGSRNGSRVGSQTSLPVVLPTSALREIVAENMWINLLRAAQVQAAAMLTCVPIILQVLGEKAIRMGVPEPQRDTFSLVSYSTAAVCALLGTCLSKCHRKDCLVLGFLSLAATFGSIFALYYVQPEAASWLQIRFLGYSASGKLALLSYSVSVFSCFVLPFSEIFSIELVEKTPAAVSVISAVKWISRAVSVWGYFFAMEHLGKWAYAIIGGVCFVSAVLVMFHPETRTRQYETPELAKKLKSYSNLSTLISALPHYGMDMSFQNFVPLFENGNFKSEKFKNEKFTKETSKNAERTPFSRMASTRMVTAQTHFDKREEPLTALWLNDSA